MQIEDKLTLKKRRKLLQLQLVCLIQIWNVLTQSDDIYDGPFSYGPYGPSITYFEMWRN